MPSAQETYDIVIIGGGATGLSAALYSARAMLKVLVLEKLACGGQILITDVIENYPGFPDGILGPDLAQLYERQATKFGAEIRYEMVEDIRVERESKVIVTSESEYSAKAVIIATGGEHNKLGVPGEEEYAGKGVSYCATCDGNFFRDQPVAVVGGGDSAVQEGLYLTQMTSKVTIVHRRDELRASRVLQQRAFSNPKMEFRWNQEVQQIQGDGLMEALILKDVNTGERSTFKVPGVFIFIGFHPTTGFLRKGLIELDGGGHIVTSIRMETNVPGIFAGGDVRARSDRQLGTAVGDGITAALSAYHYLSDDHS